MKSAKVAIITRTKNRPITLERAITSISEQTFRDYIHVIVNDGGNPDDVDQLISMCDSDSLEKIQVIHNPKSLGMEAASNVGIRSCSSEYILIHDDDDSLYPEFLEKTIAFMEEYGTLFCGVSSWMMLIKETIQEDHIVKISEKLYSSMKSVSIGQMAAANRLVPIGFLYKRCLHDEVGYYDETLPVLGDWDFFLRLLEKHDIGILPQILARYHQRTSINGIYANSLSDAVDKHVMYTAIVRNKHLRRDITNGVTGIGALCQFSTMLESLPAFSAENYIKGVVFQVQANRAENVAIYGTGNIGTQLFHELKHNGITVKCFIENDIALKNDEFLGIPVLSLQNAVDAGHYDIVIGSWEYKTVIIERIHTQLKSLNVRLRLFSI
jgi:Predicted glycosyltransferases